MPNRLHDCHLKNVSQGVIDYNISNDCSLIRVFDTEGPAGISLAGGDHVCTTVC